MLSQVSIEECIPAIKSHNPRIAKGNLDQQVQPPAQFKTPKGTHYLSR